MGTRSHIAALCADGKWRSVYCHWDGYPSHNGRILLESYQDQTKIDSLLSHGSMSSLAPEIGEKHDFDARAEGQCTFYHRDRGEDLAIVMGDRYEDIKPPSDTWGEYFYVWQPDSGDGQPCWYYSPIRDKGRVRLRKLTISACKA